MKFARYLASHRIDEWRNGYVDVSTRLFTLDDRAGDSTVQFRFYSFLRILDSRASCPLIEELTMIPTPTVPPTEEADWKSGR